MTPWLQLDLLYNAESTSYRPSPTRRLSNAASGKATGDLRLSGNIYFDSLPIHVIVCVINI